MSEADRLNAILEREAPAAHAMLSAVGRRAAFPLGNPAQSAEARGTRLNATIGQVTDGDGQAMPLPSMAQRLPSLEARKAFLYSPQAGHPDLRKAWQVRQRRLAGESTVPTSLPLVTHGLTQGLSMVADLFADSDTTVILPDLAWENYELLFSLRAQARFRRYRYFEGDRFAVDALAEALAETQGKKIVILGFPGNPSGFTPTAETGRRIAEVVAAAEGPLVAVVDDAYAGLVYEPGLARRSLFWDVAERADPARQVTLKIDGATKEFFFFPGRVGFLTHDLAGDAEPAMESKLKALGRGTVGSPPGPSQALVLDALRDPATEAQIASRIGEMKKRYRALKQALAGLRSDHLAPLPFNSGLFALVQVDRTIDADHLRRHLIEEYGVGTIVLPEQNALRIAFCSVQAGDLAEVVDRMARAASELAG